MNPLPPLRTARDSAIRPGLPPARPDAPGLSHPGLPGPARGLLGELIDVGLLTGMAAGEFVRQVGNRLGELSSRERAADALVGLGFLTRYQASRVLSGQSYGMVFGGYRVLDRIGSGSVGLVYAAEHPVLGRRVAVKVAVVEGDADPDVAGRFATEVRRLAALDHPHVVAALDAGVVPPREPGLPTLYYLVMELVGGGDVEQYVYEHGPQPVGPACEWGRQAAAALRAAHAAGVVHRDVKPSNLLLTEHRRVKLIDFGLARDFAGTRTHPRAVIGSLGFTPPEQFADAATAGPPADLYGLGVTLYWVLTGQLPYPDARTAAEMAAAFRTGPPRRARSIRPDLPAGLDDLLARLLAHNPADRPTAGEAAAALARFAAPSSYPAPGAAPPNAEDTEAGRLRAAVREVEDVVLAAEAQADAARAAVLTALAAVAAARSGESGRAQQRVAAYTQALASVLAGDPDWAMLADPRYVEDLARAAAARDVGLVGVPDEVLANAGEPLPSDYAAYEAHPVVGDGILDELAREHGAALPALRLARAVVRHHHERWDGTGYPDRLAGEAIPPAARLVAVADAYDVLRRAGCPHPDAVRELVHQSGKAFDPKVAAALAKCEAEFGRVYESIPDPDPPIPLLAADGAG